jgi:site-specific recombinase XerD
VSQGTPTIIHVPHQGRHDWVEAYLTNVLATKDPQTQDAYARILLDFVLWLPRQTGRDQFHPADMTRIALKTYFDAKKAEKKPLSRAELKGKVTPLRGSERPLRYAPTTLSRMKVSLSSFADWLIEQGVLAVNPVRGITIPRMAARPPRQLSPEQRLALKNVVERATNPTIRRGQVILGDLRGAAIFALGYYAGLRVSDVSHLLVRNTQVGPKVGWIRAGHKRETYRDLDLLNEARGPLHAYLEQGERKGGSAYVFTSQRAKQTLPEGDEDGWRLTEDGIHQWFQEVRLSASVKEATLIDDITFHDLRHDFGHRLRGQGWSLEEVAYYLGHVNADGTPSIQTTARYTQVGREHIKVKLRQIRDIEGSEQHGDD